MKFKIGDRVRYRGTKSSDGDWNEYFGKYGVKKGDVGVIKKIRKSFIDGKTTWYFVKDKIRSHTNGHLAEEDLLPLNSFFLNKYISIKEELY